MDILALAFVFAIAAVAALRITVSSFRLRFRCSEFGFVHRVLSRIAIAVDENRRFAASCGAIHHARLFLSDFICLLITVVKLVAWMRFPISTNSSTQILRLLFA